MMQEVANPKLKDRELISQFDLPATGGRRVMTWSYKGRQNLVILFLSDVKSSEARTYLSELSRQYDQYKDHNAEILVVSQENIETLEAVALELRLMFPLASDVDGSVTERYTDTTPAVFVVDRFGELCTQSEAEVDSEFPNYQQILGWLHLIELQCPECGVSTWDAVGESRWEGTSCEDAEESPSP
jgi:peroxiredoxin